MVRSLVVLVVAGVLLGLSGCGKAGTATTAKVTGTVTYKGQPAADASVAFVPEAGGGRPANGRTDAAGKFTLSTFAPSDGAVPGKHKVIVSEVSPTTQGKAPPMPGMPGYEEKKKSRFPAKYSTPQATTFSADVKVGEKNDFTFDMTD